MFFKQEFSVSVETGPTTAFARERIVIEGGVMIALDCQPVFKTESSTDLQWRLLHALLICPTIICWHCGRESLRCAI